jgi:hypothetical protein
MKEIIVAAMSTIDGDMLQRVWDESDYMINMWRVTKRAHIEHL